ncbi:hypothetical protein P8C59_003250 [Phyllachora maydis]|uniref:Uncharacterized protein n=1 Tax=Phyllachora maydis TaxID=1825666 RepID=A0AAD9HZV0_9PEZI|nr:hypothetical protein P8C59_003250 [Phyllachora maydis]
MEIKLYQSLVGTAIYIMLLTRLCFSYNGNTVADLGPKLSNSSNTTTKLSRDFYSKEGPRPLTTTSTTIVDSRNSKGSSRTSIINSSLVPIGFSNSDFAGDKATSKSTYGYLYKLAGGSIRWKTKRATTIALSTLEAKTDRLTEAIYEVQTKYTLLKFRYVREQVKAKIVTIIYLNTKSSVEDSVRAIKSISSTLASLTNNSNAATTRKTSYSPRFNPFSGTIDLDSPPRPPRKEPYLGPAIDNTATSNLDPPIDTGSKDGFKDTITSGIVKELSKKAYTIPDNNLEGAISPDPSNLNTKKPISIEIGPSKLEPYKNLSNKADLGSKLSNSSHITTKLSRDFYSKEGPRPLTTTSTTIGDSRNGKGSSRTFIINSSLIPIGFSDSDYIGDKATSQSTYSYLYKLAGRPISWKTKRATTIALSTLEAETNGLIGAIREVQWIIRLFSKLCRPIDHPITLYGDS